MRLGIIGLPAAGKTTIFNLITGANLPIGGLAGGARMDVQTSVVDVPDPRLDSLSGLLKPKKTTRARISFVDMGGLQTKTGGIGLHGTLINELAQVDGILHVIRAFEDPNVPHGLDSIDPSRDLALVEAEFILNDLMIVERRLERLEEERSKGARDRGEIEREKKLFERLYQALNRNDPLRKQSFNTEEEYTLSGFGLLSKKPLLLVINLSEGATPPVIETLGAKTDVLCLQGKLEMEISQLPVAEGQIFRNEYGIEEPGRERIIQTVYKLLGVIFFFTYNENELRSWMLPRGSSALEAAGEIHTDIARGFIRAEVIPWDELISIGGLSQARSVGKLRIEGKDYRVNDGELIYIRFNV